MRFKAILVSMLLLSITAFAQDRCIPMAASGLVIHQLTGGDWSGTAKVTFGQEALTAQVTIVTVSGPFLKGETGNAASGSELATFTFSDKDWFQVLSYFHTEHMASPDLMFYVNEAGKITAGGGIFAGVSGVTNTHNPFWIDTTELVMKAKMDMKGTICWK